jgi:hypothetical protein
MSYRSGFTGFAVACALLAAAGLDAPGAAMAEEYGDLTYATTEGDFGEVKLAVEDAIINRGLVIDYHGFLGKMLERTAEATGSDTVFSHAEWYQFCSASLSQAMVAADPRNVGYCPYTIVVYELAASPGEIHVGYRAPGETGSEESMKALGAVGALLKEIVAEATE